MEENKINKSDLVDIISEKENMSKKQVKNVIDIFLSLIEDNLHERNSVTLSGFGTFKIDMHEGHPVQFKSGKKMFIEAYPVLKFNVSKILKDRLKSK